MYSRALFLCFTKASINIHAYIHIHIHTHTPYVCARFSDVHTYALKRIHAHIRLIHIPFQHICILMAPQFALLHIRLCVHTHARTHSKCRSLFHIHIHAQIPKWLSNKYQCHTCIHTRTQKNSNKNNYSNIATATTL